MPTSLSQKAIRSVVFVLFVTINGLARATPVQPHVTWNVKLRLPLKCGAYQPQQAISVCLRRRHQSKRPKSGTEFNRNIKF